MDLIHYLVVDTMTVKEALDKIEKNWVGCVIVQNKSEEVIGIATDGDIRRFLISGNNLDDPISECTNGDFVWVEEHTPREVILKQLDNQIRVIPVLDSCRKFINIITHENIPIQYEKSISTRAKAPVRISFGGGGSDLTHYFWENKGAVINSTINLYSHAYLRPVSSKKITIFSADLNETLEAENIDEALVPNQNFRLIQSLLRVIDPTFGFELYLYSDFPMKSGLGGSAVVSAVILGAFNQTRRDKWTDHEISELAFQAERLYSKVAGGWQDQYASVFGGFNFMEFRQDQNIVHPLRINEEVFTELEESLLLCNMGTIHESGDIHEDQKKEMQKSAVKRLVKQNVDLTYKMRDLILKGKLHQFGKALHEAWEYKKQLSSKISNNYIDAIYAGALKNGALGGKILGAGGGGFFLFFVDPFKKHLLKKFLHAKGLDIQPFNFDLQGLRQWTVRNED